MTLITHLLSNKTYILSPSLVEICVKMIKLCCFNQDNPPHFSAFQALSSPVICWWLWKEPVCCWWDEDADLEMARVTADAQRDHHWQPQPCRQSSAWWNSPPPCWCVLVVALSGPRWSALCRRLSPHQASATRVYFTFPARRPRYAWRSEHWEIEAVFVETAYFFHYQTQTYFSETW